MKRMFWTLAALLLISASAPAMAQRSIYQWTGCYIGVSGGGTWGEAETDFNRVTPNGFIGGGQFGCDYQAPSNWVIGLQGEFNWADAQDRRMTGVLDLDTLDTRVNWFASATARFGYASGPWLLYGKGGAAWVRDPSKISETSSFYRSITTEAEHFRDGPRGSESNTRSRRTGRSILDMTITISAPSQSPCRASPA
jgi:outer membrane immunogenic protein